MTKCEHYDKGYCKERNNCLNEHPNTDCDGQCQDKKLCPLRHRKFCKDGENCIFYASHACEFFHKENNHVIDKN